MNIKEGSSKSPLGDLGVEKEAGRAGGRLRGILSRHFDTSSLVLPQTPKGA